MCVHKGLGGGSAYSSPVDIGPAAAANPDINFVVYHSGYDSDAEGPFTSESADVGVNRLIASLDAAGIPPGANVYAELGSTWWNVMRDPTQAAHVLGKLLARVGEDRVLWGTDSIWYGTPQDQIQAFRTFEITDAVPGRVRLPGAHRRSEAARSSAPTPRSCTASSPVVATCTADPAALEEYRARARTQDLLRTASRSPRRAP